MVKSNAPRTIVKAAKAKSKVIKAGVLTNELMNKAVRHIASEIELLKKKRFFCRKNILKVILKNRTTTYLNYLLLQAKSKAILIEVKMLGAEGKIRLIFNVELGPPEELLKIVVLDNF
jgi:hypothetical protein